VDVEKRVLAVVATQTIGRGQPFMRNAYEVREVYLDDSDDPVTDPKLLIGRTASRLLREDAIVYPKDVRSTIIVKRGELITVRCISGNLVVRAPAKAMQNGAFDEVIQVRNPHNRETYTVTVTGRREATSLIGAAHSDTQQATQ
jgi:flagella basal body P-ring formation protein FlgA